MKNSLDYGQLQDAARKILARDSIRLGNTNYTPYTGKTVSPMSSLTQKAQELEARRTQKGIPYSNSLNTLANKPNQGMSPDNINAILRDLQDKHTAFNQNITGKRLNKQFQSGFVPYQEKYNNNFDKDTGLRLANTKVDLDELNDKIKDLEHNKNSTSFNAITNSSMGKQARESNLIGMQKEFGTQKHGVNNIGLTGEKARFEAEKREPYERLSNLQRILDGTNMDEDHPDLLANNAKQLEMALKAYGVDTSLPVDQWTQSATPNLHTPTYTGKLAEPINADMATSYGLAENISPSYQDKNYAKRKNIRKELVDDPNNVGNFINDELPERFAPRYSLINKEAKQKAKADMTLLNAKYIKQGMYGGQSHIKSAAERMQELNNAAYGTTAKTLNNELMAGVNSKHSDSINKIGKLNQYDQLANSEFGNMLNDVKRTNTTGIEKWKNDQGNNEQLYKAYQNEKGYQQPRLLGNARDGGINLGINAVDSYYANQGINLSQISDLQGRYNNLEKELADSRSQIKTQTDYEAQKKSREHEERTAQIYREQQAEDERRARVNAEAMARLRGSPQHNVNPIKDPHREEAIQWRRSYPGIQAYDADWRRQHGVPEHLINHPFNMY
jgi:hypothetical protein